MNRAVTALLLVACAPPSVAWAGFCDARWDGDEVVAAISGRPSYMIVPLRSTQQHGAPVTVEQIQVFNEARERIARVAGLSPRFLICGDNDPNAFAAPIQNGDVVGVTFGMLRMIDGDRDMAAAVIGHEMAHRVHRHGEAAVTRSALIDLAAIVLGAALDARQQRRSGVPSTVGVNVARIGGALISRKFDRDQEREADEFGFRYMVSAGYDPTGAVRLAQRMNYLGGGAGLFFDSHPGWTERAQRFQTMIASDAQAQYLAARSASPNASSAALPNATPGNVQASVSPAISQATSFAARDSQDSRYVGVQFPHVQVPKVKDNAPRGKWAYQAHQAVKEYQKCYSETVALENVSDGVESYAIACHDKTRHQVLCDIQRCVAMPNVVGGG